LWDDIAAKLLEAGSAVERFLGLGAPAPSAPVAPGLSQPVPASVPSSPSAAAGDDPIVAPAFPFLSRAEWGWDAGARRALLDVQRAVGLDPKGGALPAVMYHEAGGEPFALNPLPAAGLIQLTRGANLPGFATTDAVRAVASWSPEKQLREVVLPFYKRAFPKGAPAGMDAVALLRKNFLPALAGESASYVLGVDHGAIGPNGETADDRLPGGLTRGDLYHWEGGLDTQKRGYFTWGDVDAQARAALAQGTRRGFVTVSGRVIPPGTADPALAGAPAAGGGAPAGGQLPAAVSAGTAGPIQWVSAPGPDGMTITVAADALTAPIGGAQLRAPVSWLDTIAAARAIHDTQGVDTIAPSKQLADAIYAAATVKTTLHGLVQKAGDDAKMGTVDFARRYNADVDQQIRAAGHTPGDGALVSGAEKYWLLDPRLDKDTNDRALRATGLPSPPGNPAVNYGGWIGGKPVQSVGGRHNDGHYDYSQTFRPVKRWAVGADGSPVDLLAWIRDNENVPAQFVSLFDFDGSLGGVA